MSRCTIAPTLFNLYACIIAERWVERVKEIADMGTLLLYKQGNRLFRRLTRNANEVLLQKGEFVDDVVLLLAQEMLHVLLSEFMSRWQVL